MRYILGKHNLFSVKRHPVTNSVKLKRSQETRKNGSSSNRAEFNGVMCPGGGTGVFIALKATRLFVRARPCATSSGEYARIRSHGHVTWAHRVSDQTETSYVSRT